MLLSSLSVLSLTLPIFYFFADFIGTCNSNPSYFYTIITIKSSNFIYFYLLQTNMLSEINKNNKIMLVIIIARILSYEIVSGLEF
jgi:hypothetical protein